MPDLFRALELAHYAGRFRGKTFVIGVTADFPFQNLLLDLKVLAGYRIRVVLVLPDPSLQLEDVVAQCNRRGSNFHLSFLSEAPDGGATPALSGEATTAIRDLLHQHQVPILAFHQEEPDSSGVGTTFALACQAARQLRADKLFLVGGHLSDLISAAPRAHVLMAEIAALGHRLPKADRFRYAPLLDFIADQLEGGIPDIILIDDRPGQLFQEVFTPEGAGILFNTVQREVVRQARMEDVTDIGLLLRTEIEGGRILPIDENAIEGDIDLYWVYEIDGLLVGSARLKTFGDWAEVAQFATLSRYRGKGHARTLGRRLEQEAAGMGMRHLFALSIYEGMWRFLESEGYSPVERKVLPSEWRAGYDMNRPSRAFLKEL